MFRLSDRFPRPHQAFTKGFYRDEGRDFEVRILLGHANCGSSDVGEVLAAIDGIGERDHAGWFAAFRDLGRRLVAVADRSAAAGHRESASWGYLRAATYLAAAVPVDGSDDDALLPTFREHRRAWDRFVDTTHYPVERVAIPFEDTVMPGYFCRPNADPSPRPTLVMVNGSDGAISSMWAYGGAGALARGYNVLMFDGPGQQSMLFERNVGFRPDWEAVLTPVVDFALARPDVDPDRLVAYGISQAGFPLPRALAFEHRFAAAVADPGVVDVAASWMGHLPAKLRKLYDEGDRNGFDRQMRIGMRFARATARVWNFRARPYRRDSYFDTIAEVSRYNLTDVAGSIDTPLLI
ncbi:MAG TPA: dipeptidyl aminopeptidase, partial [Aldersonia sp.]